MKRRNEPDETSFLKDVAQHEIEIVRNDGVHRHVRFRRPGTYCMSFELVTWPGHICYAGDMGCYVFTRIQDMFQFFRGKADGPLEINLGYWGEKAVAVGKHDPVKEFSADLFAANVREYLESREASGDVREEAQSVIDAAADGAYPAYSAAYEFEHDGFRFQDFSEYDSTAYTYRYIWCCYALAWAIRKYDAAKSPQSEK